MTNEVKYKAGIYLEVKTFEGDANHYNTTMTRVDSIETAIKLKDELLEDKFDLDSIAELMCIDSNFDITSYNPEAPDFDEDILYDILMDIVGRDEYNDDNDNFRTVNSINILDIKTDIIIMG